ncbi:hypothetical protein ACTS93_02435 [Empedobacter falsenii]
MKDEIKKGVLLTAINVCRMKRTGLETLTIGKKYQVLEVCYDDDEFFIKDDYEDLHSFDISDYTDFFQSLPNNGWIKVESEEDLPKEAGEYFVCENNIPKDYVLNVVSLHVAFHNVKITHYQPIVYPKPPIS